ncbi:uncharacterized protein Z519_07765 [Cladophialophora bantiana CBS 173.52]|uniref:Uncharacterized protein n=1 Tax=Cladophialophora bantiana (strain ATCC 10958 / CBS 173.52 / CDC B-1940 / NIH 8579) TaxID=1442370 RepID=A0A0D2HLW8_CLAB1|nr:uncharacterized protein Z519_07765 [Cladophialophora bantiana CBS 173.52]KIW91795.1 hypothetical protein Z519_07765 [Cladophialophora bantiana CBS 173.52]
MRTLHPRTDIYRSHRVNAVQIRTLWWWGRQTGNPWSPTEDFEERVRRHHRIMRTRYYKVLRRRALWEPEDTYIRPWRHHRLWANRYCDYKPLSSTGASVQEAKKSDNEYTSESDTIYKDFDAFRAAVDRAIARDPHGTLFGRRLQSPPSSNNSSWTSFSWFADPKEVKKDEDMKESDPTPTMTKDSIEKGSPSEIGSVEQVIQKSTLDISEEKYEYDPISMRKVPIRERSAESEQKEELEQEKQSAAPEPKGHPGQPEVQSPPSDIESKQPFFKNLFFQEHGVDIPVKTYKSHKVYDFGASEKKPIDEDTETVPTGTGEGFDSSRKQEFRDLMTRAKGNNIDTTAMFTEASAQPESELVTGETAAPKKIRELPEPDDTLPLFSGTTYEAKALGEADANASDWLVKEGFRQKTGEPVSATDARDSAVEVPIERLVSKLEPALDRVQARAAQDQNGKLARLQTALDRQLSGYMRPFSSTEKEAGAPVAPKEEIVDSEDSKKTERAKLETDFEARQKEAANEGILSPKTLKIETPTNKLTKTLNNVWEHIREYPNGIVAKTVKSMTNFNENYKKYIRPDAVKGLTEKLVFRDESLRNTPSIYKSNAKPRPVEPFTPAHDVLTDEQERLRRTSDLREATENMKRDAELEKAQMTQLAADIQAVYESEYGPINSDHRQPAQPSAEVSIKAEEMSFASSTSQPDASRPQPLSFANVKPGVATNPAIDDHISKFEPNFSRLVDEAKQIHAELRDVDVKAQDLQSLRHAGSQAEAKEQMAEGKPPLHKLSDVMQGAKEVRRELHEAQNVIRRIESGRPAIAWSAPQMSGVDFGKKRIDLKVQKTLDPPKSPCESVAANVETGAQITSEAPREEELKMVPEPIHTPSGSVIWNDEQPPPIESLRIRKFDSPYLILAYDTSTGKVNFSPLNQPTTEMPKSSNVIGILGRLKNAPEFLKHFQTMQRAGYSLYNGTENMLIFQKKQPENVTGSAVPKTVTEAQSPMDGVKPTPTANISPRLPDQEAATVLDELPTELNPVPGPAAPTAPPFRPTPHQPKLRRQEKVFSGTIPPSVASSSSNATDEKPSTPDSDRDSPDTQEGLWKRFTRGVKYTLLSLTALGLSAYSIGFVAEGLSAHAQQRKGIDDGEGQGPRKRIVMTGQRPGIFSTESSR